MAADHLSLLSLSLAQYVRGQRPLKYFLFYLLDHFELILNLTESWHSQRFTPLQTFTMLTHNIIQPLFGKWQYSNKAVYMANEKKKNTTNLHLYNILHIYTLCEYSLHYSTAQPPSWRGRQFDIYAYPQNY